MALTRRTFLRSVLGTALAGALMAVYGFFVEPALRLRVRRWSLQPPGWRRGHVLRIAILSDLHMGAPFMTLPRLRRIVRRTNALGADLIVVLGDLAAGHRFVTVPVAVADTGVELGALAAPLGVYGVLGNHDWWDDTAAQRRGAGPVAAGTAMEANGIRLLENQVQRIGPEGMRFWLAGLGDQLALLRGAGGIEGVDDLPGTLAQIDGDADPVILLAHEPDIFAKVPDRVALTLSGHTHGGQIRIFGWSPVVPSRFGNRYAYGPVREGARDLVVSGGLGCSILPVRFGVVPEITLVTLS